jgi:2-polyprenyl-3-methyl-5-hydroxy-6-metoxy-1,4-benzoquinol methylase
MVSYLDKEVLTIDLGCGVGQAAGMLHSLGFKHYHGVDFSEKAIQLAQENIKHNKYHFKCSDIFTFVENIPDGRCCFSQQFFISETLEHITGDTDLIATIAKKCPDSLIALSVPTFNDPAHVRHFKGVKDAVDRYSPFIDVEVSKQIGPWIVVAGRLKQPHAIHRG